MRDLDSYTPTYAKSCRLEIIEQEPTADGRSQYGWVRVDLPRRAENPFSILLAFLNAARCIREWVAGHNRNDLGRTATTEEWLWLTWRRMAAWNPTCTAARRLAANFRIPYEIVIEAIEAAESVVRKYHYFPEEDYFIAHLEAAKQLRDLADSTTPLVTIGPWEGDGAKQWYAQLAEPPIMPQLPAPQPERPDFVTFVSALGRVDLRSPNMVKALVALADAKGQMDLADAEVIYKGVFTRAVQKMAFKRKLARIGWKVRVSAARVYLESIEVATR